MSRDFNPFASPQTMASDRPEVMWAAENPEGLRKVKLGLTLVYAGICGILVTALGFPILMVVVGGALESPETVLLLGLVVTGVMLLLAVLMFVGQLFCLSVPAESGAKPFIIAAVCLQGIGFLGTLSGFILPQGMVSTLISGGLNLAGLASFVCFLLFLRKVATYIVRYDIAGRAVRALVVGVLSLVAIVGISVGQFVSPQVMGPLQMLVLIPGLGMLVSLVMYANTVTYLRRAITV
jgi:hypothetical protein